MVDDAIYEEYLERRKQAQNRSTWNGARGQSQFGQSPSDDPLNERFYPEAQLEGDGQAKMKPQAYVSEGYEAAKSQLGSDPITAVRTMRNNLRKQAIREREEDRPLKAKMSEDAIKQLTKAEEQLLLLSRKRTDAAVNGDEEQLIATKKKMESIKDDVIRNYYADLITDNPQMRAYGVNSSWAPPPRVSSAIRTQSASRTESAGRRTRSAERTTSARKSSARAGSARTVAAPKLPSDGAAAPSGGRFVPDYMPIRERRTRSAARSPVGTQSIPPPAAPRNDGRGNNSALRDDYDVKKNARLADILNQRRSTEGRVKSASRLPPEEDDPFKPASTYGKCPHCDEEDPNFGKSNALDEHFTYNCKMMAKCQYCGKIILVPELTSHYINRCDFLKDKKVPCKLCGLAIDREDNETDAGHPMCRRRMPPSGAQWCPLCSIAVNDEKDAWKKHLQGKGTDGCYNNPRASGSDSAPNLPEWAKPDSALGRMPDPNPHPRLRQRNRQPPSNSPYDQPPPPYSEDPYDPQGRPPSYEMYPGNPQQIVVAPPLDMQGARLIDADRLLDALRIAQQQKQKKRAKQMAEFNARKEAEDREEAEREKAKEAAAAAAAAKKK